GPSRRSSRIRSPSGVPPGSRVATTSRPPSARKAAASPACVDLPDPSTPSNVTNIAGLRYGPMRAIVTGGAGVIGSHVADALAARGDEVHVLDDLSSGRRENVPAGTELHVADIRDPAAVFDAVRPEVVFHLAAQASVTVSVAKPLFDAEVNVLGTIALLDAALAHGAQL